MKVKSSIIKQLKQVVREINAALFDGRLADAQKIGHQAAEKDPNMVPAAIYGSIVGLNFSQAWQWDQKDPFSSNFLVQWAHEQRVPDMNHVAEFIFYRLRAHQIHPLDFRIGLWAERGAGVPQLEYYLRRLSATPLGYQVTVADPRMVGTLTKEYEEFRQRQGVDPRLLMEFNSPGMQEYRSEIPNAVFLSTVLLMG